MQTTNQQGLSTLLGYQLQGFTAVVIAVVCNTYRFCILVFVACRTVVATFSFLSNDDGLLLRDLQLSMKNNKHVEGQRGLSHDFSEFCKSVTRISVI